MNQPPLLWSDVADWQKIYTYGMVPSPRHVVSCGIIDNYIVLFGGYGYSSTVYSDCHLFDLNTNEWTRVIFKDMFKGYHSSSCFVYNRRLYLFGGVQDNSEYSNDIVAIDPFAVKREVLTTTGEKPSPRWGHSCAIYGDQLYVFGGYGTQLHNDLYVLNLNTKEWRKVEPSGLLPRCRQFHTSVIYNDRLYVTGGYAFNHNVSDMFYYAIKDNRWYKVFEGEFVDIRAHSSSVIGDRMYIYGGRHNRIRGGLVEYNFTQNSFRKITLDGLEHRYFHSACIYNNNLYILMGIEERNLNSMICIEIDSPREKRVVQNRNSGFEKLLGSKILSDVIINVDGRSIPAHRCILYARCKYFEGSFGGFMRESHEEEIKIRDISYPIFMKVLEYIYSGEADIRLSEAVEVLKASDLLLLDDLKTQCQIILSKTLPTATQDDFSNLLDIGQTYSCTELVQRCCRELKKKNHDFVDLVLDSFEEPTKVELKNLISQ